MAAFGQMVHDLGLCGLEQAFETDLGSARYAAL